MSIATAWEIFNVAPTIVVGQMKLTVALTHPILEVYLFICSIIHELFWSLSFTNYNPDSYNPLIKSVNSNYFAKENELIENQIISIIEKGRVLGFIF